MENKVKKLNAWGHIKCVNTRKSSEGQRGSHTVNSFGETSRKWVNSMGKLMFIFCELSKEKFFSFHSWLFFFRYVKVHPSTIQWCSTCAKTKAKSWSWPMTVLCTLILWGSGRADYKGSSFFFGFFLSLRLHLVFIATQGLFSSCGRRGLLFLVACSLVIAVASLVMEHRL